MTNTLQPLPFDHHALEPNMSATTLSFHHGKHLATYLDNVNRMVKDTPMEAYPLEKICREAEGALLNNAAQAWNHLFFFEQLAPNPNQPSANMRHRLETAFDSMEQFNKQFSQAAISLFGSGWVWLTADDSGYMHIRAKSNAGNPIEDGEQALLCIDLWEHAYYLDYQNRRTEYVEAFWKVLNWQIVEERCKLLPPPAANYF